MSEKCQHNSTIVLLGDAGFSVERCTWTCQDLLISILMPNGITETQTVAEYSAMKNELEFFHATFPNATKNYQKVMEKMKEIENG